MPKRQLSHFPVMVNEVVSFLEPKQGRTYLDCTFGQGGYSRKILESAKCKVYAIDRDLNSNKYAKILSQKFNTRFTFRNTKFSELPFFLDKNNIKDILNPYFTTKKTGTGLGLPIVTKIINEHSGNFSIQNKKEGNGTIINILLPKANA